MTKRICARPGCAETAKNKYCSRTCANKDKTRVREERLELASSGTDIKVSRSPAIPKRMEKALVNALGYNDARLLLSEMEAQYSDTDIRMAQIPHHMDVQAPLFQTASPDVAIPRKSLEPNTSSEIEPHTALTPFGDRAMRELRERGQIPFEDIDRMQRSAPCVLAARMKKAPLVAALSGNRKWSVHSSDEDLRAITARSLQGVFLKNIQDMLTAMDYGAAFGSTIWAERTAEQIGIENEGVSSRDKWNVVDKIQWAHPTTVREILRTKDDYSFNGYVHSRQYRKPKFKVIPPLQSLVLTYGGRFDNMWGKSMFEPVYDFWYWYELALRDFMRYMQRMATPVAVCYAPGRGTTTRPDGTTVDNAQYALMVAGYAAQHSGLFIPSDVDPTTGKELWRLEYLDTDQKGDQFVKALQYFGTQIMRGVVVGDNSATSSDSETGSYAMAEVHDKNTQVDNNMIFNGFLTQTNQYLVQRYAKFNRGFNDHPSIRVEAEVLDPLEREILMKLFATAGNVTIGGGTPLDRVDWEEAFAGLHVPVLTDEEIEEKREAEFERSMKEQEKRLKMQARNSASPPGKNGGGQGPPSQKDEQVKAAMAMIEHVADGGSLPVVVPREYVTAMSQPQGGGPIDLSRVSETAEVELGMLEDLVRDLESLGRKAKSLFTKDGKMVKNPKFEEKISRDEKGRFAKKEGEGSGGSEDSRDNLGEEPWPGADPDRGIKGVVTLDGVQYTVLDGVSRESVLATHEINSRMLERASELEYNFEPTNFVITSSSDLEATAKYTGARVDSLKSVGGFVATYNLEGEVMIDDKLYQSEHAEATLFHETLHTQPRKYDDDRGGSSMYRSSYTEETYTTLLTMEYCNKYNLQEVIGYPAQVATMARASEAMGWDREKLYRWSRIVHSLDGEHYPSLHGYLLNRAGKMTGGPDDLSKFSPNWESVWREWSDLYGWDFDPIERLWQ